MNILTEKLVDYVEIEGEILSINPSFALFIDFIQGQISKDYERASLAVMQITNNCTRYEPQLLTQTLFEFALGNKKKSTKGSSKVVFDYDIDSSCVYADFIRFYNIKLDVDNPLHWLEFKALFDNLPDSSQTSKRMSVRGISSKKEAEKMGYNWDKVKEIQQNIKIEVKQDEVDERLLKEIDDLFYNS